MNKIVAKLAEANDPIVIYEADRNDDAKVGQATKGTDVLSKYAPRSEA